MNIRIHNTLTGKKDKLEPIEPGHVKLYVCGITSYDYCHLGHARSSLAFDMIVKYLKYRGLKVTYVRNFTDIDDKIINRANERGIPPEELAQQFIDEFYTDMDALGVDRPDIEPRATEHVQEMIDLIQSLIEDKLAYQAGSDVYFSVKDYPEYGKLSKRNIDDLQAGARVDVNDRKRNPLDFALWKGAKPGEPEWDSPWGPGRPGWHIECSAMSKKYLGETFDIHGGGKDLVFPHHENELAQSEGANNKPFVNVWVHHGFVTIKDEKMSKSLGNFLTIRETLKHHAPEVLRYFIFSTHYRTPLNFHEKALLDAEAGLDRLYECVASVEQLDDGTKDLKSVISEKDRKKLSQLEDRFQKAMDNDFNTASALGALFETVKVVNKTKRMLGDSPASDDVILLKKTIVLIKKLGSIMGILQQEAASYLKEKTANQLKELDIDEQTILVKIEERLQARKNKDWDKSDKIRDDLLARGIELKDNADNTSWAVKRK